MSKYKKIMERVRVDEEMKGRVLENLEREMDKAPSKAVGSSLIRKFSVRYAAVAAAFVILFIGTYAVLRNGGIIKNPMSNEQSAPAAESPQQMPAMEDSAMEEKADRTEMTAIEESAMEEADLAEMTATEESAMEQNANGIAMPAKEPGDASEDKSLAQRMAGKYSYHYSDKEGEKEFYIMEVVPFGDNLYAFCGQAMDEDSERLEAYSFWASEFIPYDAKELTSTDGDMVTVNELCFSVMSNAGKYWNAGYKGTITLTDDGLVFDGFDKEGFLVSDNGESRLFLKDDRVEDAFDYLRGGKGDEELEGLWILERNGADIYLEFAGANMYVYSKDPGLEVFYAAGGYDSSDGTITCTASRLDYGGMPLELSFEYEVSGDKLTLRTISSDIQDMMPMDGEYKKVRDGKVHVTTMDEVELDPESFGSN